MGKMHRPHSCAGHACGGAEMWLLTMLIASVAIRVAADPILGPDLNSCRPIIPPKRTEAEAVSCCLVDRPIIDFKFRNDGPVRVRRPLHKLDNDFIRKYERAYEIMRNLPDSDPRSLFSQSNIHCAYCAQAYAQFNSSALLDVHHGWLLLPFHRWFMYFHERILGSLIGDDTFAIPYWAWDVQYDTSPDPPANIIPYFFLNPNSSLYDPYRCQMHMPPMRVDLKVQNTPYNKEPEELIRNNHYNMWRVMIGDVQAPESFFGGKFAKDDDVLGKSGRFELGPHGAVHGWTGSEFTVFGEDMKPAYSAARDPIFFAHHSQVDRLWLMYNEQGGRNIDDPDWLDAEFLLYDENSDFVRVRIRDALDITKLRVSYEQVPAEWPDFIPKSIRQTDDRFARKSESLVGNAWRSFWRVWNSDESAISRLEKKNALRSRREVLTVEVHRPEARMRRLIMQTSNVSVLDEVLLLEGTVTKPFDMMVLVDVFLDLPEADQHTPLDCAESLGSIYMEAEGRRSTDGTSVARKFSHVIGIGPRYQLLSINDAISVTITFVPAWEEEEHDDDAVTINFTKVELELRVAR